MTIKQAKDFFDQQKANGMTEEEIVGTLYLMYQSDDITLDELEEFCAVLGWEFTDEFKAMSEEDKKTKGLEDIDD